MHSQIKKYAPTLIFTCGIFILTVYIFFPGFLSIDSEWQLKMATIFKFVDWHPPVMALLWAGLNHIYYGPASMLVFHNIIFWTALFLFSFKVFPDSNWQRILLILLFGLLPTVYIQLGSIWKDTSLSVSLFLVCVLLLYLDSDVATKIKVLLVLVILPLLFYATAVRLNAVPAVIVICFWMGEILFGVSLIRNLIFAVGLTVLFLLVNKVIVDDVLHAIHSHPFQQVQIHDLAAISLAKKQLLFPPYITQNKKVTLDKIAEFYHPSSVGYFIFKNPYDPKSEEPLIRPTASSANAAALTKLWWSSIKDNPLSYLIHRSNCFIELMISCIAYQGEVCATPYGITFHTTMFYNLYCKVLTSSLVFALFHAWIYFINCLFCVVIALTMRTKLAHYQPIFYVALSGAVYVLGQFFYTPANEFRYVYWTIIASIFALIFFVQDFFAIPAKSAKVIEFGDKK